MMRTDSSGERIIVSTISPFLWFDTQAEEAANFYVSIFPSSAVTRVSRYPEGGPMPAGTALGVSFVLDGVAFEALNAGPQFPFTEAISFFTSVETQEEVDYYWNALLAGGGEESRCGWLKDRYGLSWQVVPGRLGELLGDSDPQKAGRVMAAMMTMSKIVIEDLEAAYAAA
jgi:predicted 3-demethylubiquinone-9 3-methyltransferase (glyoxalase superfamily)